VRFWASSRVVDLATSWVFEQVVDLARSGATAVGDQVVQSFLEERVDQGERMGFGKVQYTLAFVVPGTESLAYM